MVTAFTTLSISSPRIAEKSDTTKQQRSFSYPKPRAVLTWSPDKDDQVRLRYEKVVGQLDFGNFIAAGNLGGNGVTGGNSDIRPDQRTQYELSYEHHFWDKGAVTWALFWLSKTCKSWRCAMWWRNIVRWRNRSSIAFTGMPIARVTKTIARCCGAPI